MKKEILSILVCPKCNGILEKNRKSSIDCKKCKLRFRILDDVPDMIIEDAENYRE